MKRRWLVWFKRFLLAAGAVIVLILLVGIPVGGSFLITNSRFRFPERGPNDPAALGLEVEDVGFVSPDGVGLEGWWNDGDNGLPVLIFVHGLNRSRLELLERGADASNRGFGVLLFDLRNHGSSGDDFTTLGVRESLDVCAAMDWVRENAPDRRIILWGVSLGASTALLSIDRCEVPAGVIADSAFLSFDETVAHHLTLYTPLPAFPIAHLLIALTRLRMDFESDDGDVELAVSRHPEVPVLFVAGREDQRMPPALAERLRASSSHPDSSILIIDEATHGRAYERDPDRYLEAVYAFIGRALLL